MAITVTATSGEELREFAARATDPKAIGKIVGLTLESQSQRAFLEQRLGEWVWPERYPNMDDPFVNLAALVNWTSAGGQVQRRFFDRRPALMGGGDLARSVSSRVSNGVVEVGSALPYAGLHQWGGPSSQPVTEQAKKTIGKYIGEEKVNGAWRQKKNLGAAQKRQRKEFFYRLHPLLGMTTMETTVNQRPFLGITDENEREMVETIEHFVATGET
jgi:phage gpG-like protein